MKKTWAAVVLGGLMLGLAGCGNICDRGESVTKSMNDKIKDCVSTTETFDKAKCNSNLSKCNAADQTLWNKYMDCVDKLPKCEKASADTWTKDALACTANMTGLSKECQEAMTK